MVIIQATNTFVFLMACGTFLVENVLLNTDASLASAEPSHVLGIKTGEFLG
jgi:hypothetical protein